MRTKLIIKSKLDIRRKRLSVPDHATVGHLMHMIRSMVSIAPEEALYAYIEGSLYATHKLIKDIPGTRPLQVEVCAENTFGDWSKSFIKAEIKKVGPSYKTVITYSWYGLSHYTCVDVFASLDEAKLHVLHERCGGKIYIE